MLCKDPCFPWGPSLEELTQVLAPCRWAFNGLNDAEPVESSRELVSALYPGLSMTGDEDLLSV